MYSCYLSMTSGFQHKVEENCTLLRYYAASNGNLLLTFQHKTIGPIFRSQESRSQDGPIRFPELQVRN